VLRLSLPAIGEQLLGAVVGITDTVIAGHMPGDANRISAATAAVGLMTYLQWFAGLMTAALAVGATAIVSRAIGAKRVRMANRAAGTAVAAGFLVSIVTAGALFIFAHPIVQLCGLTGLAGHFAIEYLRIMVVTISLQTAGQIGMATVRGSGDTIRPMWIMAAVMVVNGVASASFTYGWLGAPAWGVRGNAFGTLLAYATGGAGAAIILFGKQSRLNIKWRHLRIAPHVLQRILKIGMPSWFEGMLLWGGQFLIVIFVINSRNDPNGYTMAAHTGVLRVESIAFLPGFGFGIAASALVGQYLGAGKPDEARRAAHIANRLALITMTVLAIPMVACPRFMLSLMVHSPPVVAVGHWPMVLAGLAQPGFAIAIVLSGALKGAGETMLPMLCTVSGVFIVRVGLLLLILWWMAVHGITNANLTAVWIAIFIDLCYRGVFNTLAFQRSRWQYKRV
jgi:putative MATE family efflux protein